MIYEDRLDGRLSTAVYDENVVKRRGDQDEVLRSIQDHQQADEAYLYSSVVAVWGGDSMSSSVSVPSSNITRMSGTSRYAISKATGITQPQLSRLMHKKSGLSIESLERLADFLELEIVIRPKERSKGKK